jgi:hypothetical protein
MDPEALAIARERLRPMESVHEDQVQPEEHIYAEVHQEDPDAMEVAPGPRGRSPWASNIGFVWMYVDKGH